jgi:hypothetical protein
MKNYESPVDALNDLRKRGYEADFSTDADCLYCGDIDIRLNPEEFHVDEIHRFDANSSPDNNSVVYAITSSTGVRGTLVDAYGVYSESLSFGMVKKLQQDHSMLS